jgi:hypothetical protein
VSDNIATLGVTLDTSRVKPGVADINTIVPAAKGAQAAVTALSSAGKPAGDALTAVATASKAVGNAHAAMSTQSMAAMHSLRSLTEGLLSGSSLTQIFAQQIGHATYALSGGANGYTELGSSILKVINPLTLITGGLAAVAVGGGIATAAIAKSEVAFSALADRIGVSVTALHALESAAAAKGIGTADFTKGIEGFATLSEQATHNVGSLAEEFRLTNTSVGTLEQNFSRAADLIAGAKDDAARYAIIQQLGLPPTAQWVALLKQGGAGIKAAADAAVALGGETDEALVKSAKKFDETWDSNWNNFTKYAKSAIIEAGGFLATLEQKSDAFANSVRDKLGLNPTRDLSADLGLNSIGRNLSAEAGINDIGKPKTQNIVDVKNNLSQDNQRISVLGNLASVTDIVRQKQNELQLAFLAGSGVTKTQSAAILDYTRNLALGVIANQHPTNRASTGRRLHPTATYKARRLALPVLAPTLPFEALRYHHLPMANLLCVPH